MANIIKVTHQNNSSAKISLGQIYVRNNKYYILAAVNPTTVGLISLQNGLLWNLPVAVNSFYDISQKEFDLIKNQGEGFELFKGTLEITTND